MPDQNTDAAKAEQLSEIPEKTVESKPEVKLPEGNFFQDSNWDKYLEQAEIFKEEKIAPEPVSTKTPAKAEEDCPDCPGGKKTTQAAPGKPVEPYAVVKVGGKDTTFANEADYQRWIAGGTQPPPQRQGETLLDLGKKVNEISELSRLEREELKEDELDEELLMENPSLANYLKGIKSRLDRVEAENVALKGDKQERDQGKMVNQLDKIYQKSRESHEFDDVTDESGKSITNELFSGVLTSNIIADIKAATSPDGRTVDTKKLKSAEDYMVNTAKAFARLDKAYKEKYSSGNGSTEPQAVTAEDIRQNHPEVFKEVGELWLAARDEEQEEKANPSPRSQRADVSPEKEAKKGKRGTLEDRFKAANEDPELRAAFADAQRGSPI